VNNDLGVTQNGTSINYGHAVMDYFADKKADSLTVPFTTRQITSSEAGEKMLKGKLADAMIVIPDSFSTKLQQRCISDSSDAIPLEITGDLTNSNYLISAIWANELINAYLYHQTRQSRIMSVKETALGASARMSDFDMIVPGILIISLIMLMFTASIAFVSEIENKTIMRLKLSRLHTLEFLGGIGIVQSIVGIVAMVLTLMTAILLGFEYEGSLLIMLIIAGLTSLSIIAFSLIIAAFTKSANEVLIIGNFPMFLFMFFTGAAFPMKSNVLFTIAGYPVTAPGLMTPVHAISALNKTLVMNMDLASILPEIIAIITLTILYFTIGGIVFKYRHLKMS
jgi:ABC-2 type transport system permease protein